MMTILKILAAVGSTTIIVLLVIGSLWLKDLGNAFINKYKRK